MAGEKAKITDSQTGKCIDACIFIGALSYSQYAYVEAFIDEKQNAWITAHVHMLEYFQGVPKIIVPDNTATAVNQKTVIGIPRYLIRFIMRWQNIMVLPLSLPEL